MKRATEGGSTDESAEPCAECGAVSGADHSSWCLAMEEDEDEHAESGGHSAL
ncbi:MAG: hypothetical protein ACRDZY_00805 [Acidimicrobiales bacterium]